MPSIYAIYAPYQENRLQFGGYMATIDIVERSAREIRELRDKLNLNQDEFASRFGIKPRTFQRWEKEGLPASANRANQRAILAAEEEAGIADTPVVQVERQAEVLKRKIAASLEDLDFKDLASLFEQSKRMQARTLARRYEDDVRDELEMESRSRAAVTLDVQGGGASGQTRESGRQTRRQPQLD